jgi:Fe-Mn family superoxide dismutase
MALTLGVADVTVALRRRTLLATATCGGVGAVIGCSATPLTARTRTTTGESRMPQAPALAANHGLLPLPFDPSKLAGLSERLVRSHHEKNYAGAVKNLNRVEQELIKITPDTPPFVVAALRDRELTFRNSKALHEAYFANLGGDGRRAGAVDKAIAEAYPSPLSWEQHFRATAAGLGGGSGWVVLVFELDTGALRTVGAGNHKEVPAGAVPLLVLDMYEHSYHLDYGAEHARYIDAFMANVRWGEVDRRFQSAQRAATALRG